MFLQVDFLEMQLHVPCQICDSDMIQNSDAL